MTQGARPSWVRVMGNPDFRLLWISQALSGLGSAVHQIASVVYIYEVTGSPLTVTVLLATTILPTLLLASVVAVTIDRYPYRQTMIITDFLRGLVVMAMAWWRLPVPLLILTFVQASLGRFFTPSQLALIPRILPKDDLHVANSLNSVTWRTLTLIGPVLAAWIVARWGAPGAFYFNGLTYIVSALLLFGLKSGRSPVSEAGPAERSSFRRKWAEGISVLRGDPVLWWLLIISIFLGLPIGVNNALLVVFIGERLGLQLASLGIFSSALAAGFILGGVVVGSARLGVKGRQKMVVVAVTALGLGFGLFGLNRSYPVALLLRSLIGFGFATYVILSTTIYQERLPQDLRGKGLSLYGALDDTASLLTLGLAGLLGQVFPVEHLFSGVGLGVLMLAVFTAVRWFRPGGRSREETCGA